MHWKLLGEAARNRDTADGLRFLSEKLVDQFDAGMQCVRRGIRGVHREPRDVPMVVAGGPGGRQTWDSPYAIHVGGIEVELDEFVIGECLAKFVEILE